MSDFTDTTYDKNHFITRALAEFRAEIIENVSYEVSLALPRGEHFFGKVTIGFDLGKVPP